MILGSRFVLKTFKTVNVNLWNSDNPVSKTLDEWKRFGWFVKMWSIRVGFSRFLKYVGCFRSSDPRPATLLKRKLWHRCFPVNFAKFLRTPFLQNTSGRLLFLLYQILKIVWRTKFFQIIISHFSIKITYNNKVFMFVWIKIKIFT